MRINYLFNIILFITVIHLLITPVRFLIGFNPNSLILGTYLLVSLFIFVMFLEKKLFLKLTKIEIFIIILPFVSLSITFVLDNSLTRYIIMDLIKPLLFISTIVFFKYINLNQLCSRQRIMTLLMYLILFAGVFSIVVLVYLYTTIGGFYLSATNILILIPTFYFIVKKNKIAVLIAFIGILYASKRGVLLALLGALFSMYIVKIKNYNSLIVAIFIAFFVITVTSILITTGQFDKFLIVKKVITGLHYAEGRSIIFAFSGRAEEIIGSIKIFIDNPVLLITGAGLGYVYDITSLSSIDLEDVHGVHFSPLGIFSIYGPVFFIFIYWYILKNLKRSYYILKNYKGNCPLIKTGALFIIANFIASFTAFSIFTPIYFAIFIGIINNIHIKENK